MTHSQKNVFWQALLLACFVFAAGILLGFFLENWRSSQIESLYFQAELDLLDIRIKNDVFLFSEIDCNKAIEENIAFADRVYEEAKLLDRYEKANEITSRLILEHKKYDLLRTFFWLTSIKIKERCNASYHNVVYLYQYSNSSIETKAKQSVFSKILAEIKEEKKNDVMLIPIAGDNKLSSLSLLMSIYNITESELPVILIDEKIKINEIGKKEDILKSV